MPIAGGTGSVKLGEGMVKAGGPGADMRLEQAKKTTIERVLRLVGKRIMGG